MNLIELRQAVASLMFESDIVDNQQFFQSVNRAIYRTRMNFPKVKSYKIAQYPIKNMLGENHSQVYDSGRENVFNVKDLMSFSFEALGKGRLVVKWYNPSNAVLAFEEICVVEFESYKKFTKYKGFAKRFGTFMTGEFRLSFEGEYIFQVKNIALYDEIRSAEVDDIDDFSENITYDLKSLTSEYGKSRGVSKVREAYVGLSKSPKLVDGDEEIPLEYKLVDGNLQIPRKYVGEISLEYIAEPETVGDGSLDNDEIDVPNVICDSVAYLVASNLTLDDDKEKSNYYLSMFKEAEANALQRTAVGNQVFQNTSMWAG
ncbi:MAG: hypothetical protein RR327_03995 [Clostridia bacterium]